MLSMDLHYKPDVNISRPLLREMSGTYSVWDLRETGSCSVNSVACVVFEMGQFQLCSQQMRRQHVPLRYKLFAPPCIFGFGASLLALS